MPNIKIAIIISRFNEDITQMLHHNTLNHLEGLGIGIENRVSIWVPGAIEIPITAQRVAQTQRYQCIIALGAVIMGETKHFDYVCQQVSQGCLQVSLSQDVPIIFGVLTTENEEQAYARAHTTAHYVAHTAVEMLSVLDQIKS